MFTPTQLNSMSINRGNVFGLILLVSFIIGILPSVSRSAEAPKMSDAAREVPHTAEVFRPDPVYEEEAYSADAQRNLYGNKTARETPRPLIELGRRQYVAGTFSPGINLIGQKNLIFPALSVYGDWRSALAYNDNGAKELGVLATRLNLDIDLKLTSTERLHAFIRPLDKGGLFSRHEFSADGDDDTDIQFDGNLDSLFFEGDIGSIATGLTDTFQPFDLPFSFGLMPLVFQNGVWIEDAFTGLAASIPARNSRLLDISNMDITAFAAFDKVTNLGFVDTSGALDDHKVDIFGVASFVEANQGYWEMGIATLEGNDDLQDLSHTNFTISHTRRFSDLFSNSIRMLWIFGQDRDNNVQQTADGVALLFESSLISSKPLTLVPYLNLFGGFDRPQSAARDSGAGGLLKNTGINFETDGLTGFPKLDDTAHNSYGGAIGVSYLFNLDRQIVIEAATAQVMEGANEVGRAALDDQYALGFRFQQTFGTSWILRSDVMLGFLDSAEDLSGIRFEIRRKF